MTRVSEMPELVSRVDIKILGETCLQRYDLIETSEVITSNTDCLRIRIAELGAVFDGRRNGYRESGSH